jgi:hypothetical protein
MTHSEQEDFLRRALHAVADTIEPAPDGLERIRQRLSRPRPVVVAWVIAAWTGMVQAVQLRMDSAAEGEAGWLGSWLRVMARFLRASGDRLRPAIEALLGAGRALRPGSGMSRHEKLRSAIAFGAAALIGAAGGFALSAGLPQQVISIASSALSSGQTHHSGNGGNNGGTSNGSGRNLPSGSSTGPGSTRKTTPSPSPSCRRKPTPSTSPNPEVSTQPATTTPPTKPTTNPSTGPTTTPPTTTPPTSTPSPTATQTGGGVGPSTSPNQSSDATPSPTTTGTNAANRIADGAHPGGTPRRKATTSPC